jgi:hypothetical protein
VDARRYPVDREGMQLVQDARGTRRRSTISLPKERASGGTTYACAAVAVKSRGVV